MQLDRIGHSKSCLEDHVSTVSKTFKLRTTVPQKVTFYRGDARMMMDAAMEDLTSTGAALQFCTSFRYLTQSRVRPSIVFFTKYYNKYVRVGDTKLSRVKSGIQTDRLCLKWTIKDYKGHQKEENREVEVTVNSPSNIINLDFDSMFGIVVRLFRRRFWPGVTPDDFYDSEEFEIPLDLVRLDEPLTPLSRLEEQVWLTRMVRCCNVDSRGKSTDSGFHRGSWGCRKTAGGITVDMWLQTRLLRE
jgi:hypothetical protein